MPDASQPIKRYSDAEALRLPTDAFTRNAGKSKLAVDNTGVEQPEGENVEAQKEARKQKSQLDLSYIESLRDNSAFQWFYGNCVLEAYQAAKTEFENNEDPAKFERLSGRYQVLKKVVNWLDSRELAHRQLLNPDDPLVSAIRKRLDSR